MQDAHRDQTAMLLRLDASHARLHQERRQVALARQAVESIKTEPLADVDPADSMSVGAVAIALGIRPSTLRHWEAERLLNPARTATGARIYNPTDVRDARLIHQLRQAGHRIRPLRDLLPMLQTGGSASEILTDRERSIHARSQALLSATIALAHCLSPPNDPGPAP